MPPPLPTVRGVGRADSVPSRLSPPDCLQGTAGSELPLARVWPRGVTQIGLDGWGAENKGQPPLGSALGPWGPCLSLNKQQDSQSCFSFF